MHNEDLEQMLEFKKCPLSYMDNLQEDLKNVYIFIECKMFIRINNFVRNFYVNWGELKLFILLNFYYFYKSFS